MSENVSVVFLEGLRELGLLSSAADEARLLAQFQLYQQELLDWNTRFNLTAITDPEEVYVKHFLDSLALLKVCDGPALRFLDIGSGAGFPGLPLKIVRPDWSITLLEATGKKALFLSHIVEALRLEQITVIPGRAEELAHKPLYRASFDVVTARAVASLSTLLEVCAPYCRVGGAMVLPKKGDLSTELPVGKRMAAQVGARLEADVPVTLPGLTDGRRLLLWRQQKSCPKQFPRSWAAMTKKPLNVHKPL